MIQRIPYVGLASLNSLVNVARNGNTIATLNAAPGTISVVCSASITTSSVVATFKLQVSPDGTNFYDLAGSSASHVTFTTAGGTGSAVTTEKVLWFDTSAHSFSHVRVVATLSGASTNSPDVTSATYYYVPAGKLPA